MTWAQTMFLCSAIMLAAATAASDSTAIQFGMIMCGTFFLAFIIAGVIS